jgi:hypothetical protein
MYISMPRLCPCSVSKIKTGSVMEIQNFITEFKKTFVYDLLSQTLTDEQLFEHAIDGDGVTWFKEQMRQMWDLWQAAKAQAVPEGFVLIKASDRDQEMLELIDQRDHMESQAEELKDKLQALYGLDFGEHSSCNFPFQNAIDYDDSDLVLVPKEPTEAMYIAGIDKRQSGGNTADVYKAMIEAQEQSHV